MVAPELEFFSVVIPSPSTPPTPSQKEKELREKGRKETELETVSKSKQQKQQSLYFKPVQIRLSGHRSQMEIVILPVPCCSDTCNRFGRGSREMEAKRRHVSKNLKTVHGGEARFLPSSEKGRLDQAELVSFWPLQEGPASLRPWNPTGGRQVQGEQEFCMARTEFEWRSLQTTQDQNVI